MLSEVEARDKYQKRVVRPSTTLRVTFGSAESRKPKRS